jgi:putative phage-type endonuclease
MERGRRVGVKPGTQQWHAWRAAGITASDTAGILGLSPWTSPYDLWWAKKARRDLLADGVLPPADGPSSQRFAIGHAMEPLLHRFFAAEQLPDGWRIGSGGCWQRRGAKDWMRATPDRPGTRTPVALLEFKTSSSHDDFGDDPGNGLPEIPVHYRAQAVHQMLTVGVSVCWLSVLTADMAIRHYRVDLQPDEFTIVPAMAVFHRSLDGGVPPDIDGHDATAARIKDRWGPDLRDVEVTVSDGLADEYHAAIAARKAAAVREQTAKNLLLEAIGTGRRAVTPTGRKVCSRSVSYRRGIDTTALAADHPDLAAEYQRTSTTPTVRLTETPPKPAPKPITGRNPS